jgi:hypothetical protein
LIQAQGHDPAMIAMAIVNAFPRSFPAQIQGAAQAAQQRLQTGQPGQQYQGQAQQGYDPRFLNYVQQMEQRLGGIEQHNQAQMQMQTEKILNDWARDKPHFETVRRRMGEILMPHPETGHSIIPLKPDGSVDLDSAYDFAVRTHPTLGEEYVQERIASEKRAANEAARKARMASGSLMPRAPAGNNNLSGAKSKQGRKSVRDSLLAAVAEHSGNSKY